MSKAEPSQAQLLSTLLELSQALNSESDVSSVLRKVVFALKDLVGCQHASLVLWNAELGQFEQGASTNLADVARRVRQQGGATRYIMDTGETLKVNSTRKDMFSANPMTWQSGIRSYAGVPIAHGNERLGVLYALAEEEDRFGPSDMIILESLASVAATAIHNALMVGRLEQLSQFKDALIRLAAHDLRTPVSLATGYLDLLLLELQDNGTEFDALTEPILEALRQMLEIIDDVLDFTRWSPGATLKRSRFDLSETVRTVIGQHRFLAERKDQTLELVASGQPVPYAGDGVLMARALSNLIVNAIKYTPHGGTIVVRVERLENAIELAVGDNGPGIPQEEMSDLFRPFSRLSSAGQEPGSGLGLSLVQQIVERHGGRVQVESEEGRGSTFTLRLPSR